MRFVVTLQLDFADLEDPAARTPTTEHVADVVRTAMEEQRRHECDCGSCPVVDGVQIVTVTVSGE